MTPEQLRECLAKAHWSQRKFADIINYSHDTIRKWSRGKLAIPSDVADYLFKVAKAHENHPAPIRQ